MPVCVPVALGNRSSSAEDDSLKAFRVRAELLEQGIEDAVVLGQQCAEQMQRGDFGMVRRLRALLRAADGFLGFDS